MLNRIRGEQKNAHEKNYLDSIVEYVNLVRSRYLTKILQDLVPYKKTLIHLVDHI